MSRAFRNRRSTPVFALLLAAALFFPVCTEAKNVTLAWDPNPAEEEVAGYELHYGTTSRYEPGFQGYDSALWVGDVTEYTLELPDDASPRFLALTVYNRTGMRSDYSEEIVADDDAARSAGKVLAADADRSGGCFIQILPN